MSKEKVFDLLRNLSIQLISSLFRRGNVPVKATRMTPIPGSISQTYYKDHISLLFVIVHKPKVHHMSFPFPLHLIGLLYPPQLESIQLMEWRLGN
jgi:hypothetical protein